MRRLGDKICAKRLAEQAGIPVVPWGDVTGRHRRRRAVPGRADRLPGGAQGERRRRRARRSGGSTSPADLEAAFGPVRRDAARVFNDRTVFVERWMPGMRHIEVQIQADRHGTIWAIGTRDCSLQRR